MKGNTFFNLIERNKAMPPKIHSHGLKSFGFAFRVVRIVGAGFRVGASPQALRDFLTGFLKHGARPNTLAGNNQRTADLAGKAANSRGLRTVSLFAGVANGHS